MGIQEKIDSIELEMARTQKNKATEVNLLSLFLFLSPFWFVDLHALWHDSEFMPLGWCVRDARTAGLLSAGPSRRAESKAR
jgi:hypothetical protein